MNDEQLRRLFHDTFDERIRPGVEDRLLGSLPDQRIRAWRLRLNKRSAVGIAGVAFAAVAVIGLSLAVRKTEAPDGLAALGSAHAIQRVPVEELNLGFEEGGLYNTLPTDWYGGGKGYELTVDRSVYRSGTGSGRIRFVGGPSPDSFGTLTKCVAPMTMTGKKVEYDGYVRTDAAPGGWAALWMRVDGPNQQMLAFDNMAQTGTDRSLKGKNDWTPLSIVLDVPKTATHVCFGFLLTGGGTAWADDLSLTAIGPAGGGTAATGFEQQQGPPSNLDFERGGTGYELTVDQHVHHGGAASARIRFIGGASTAPFGVIGRCMTPGELSGKRVEYAGYLRSDLPSGSQAALWMRVNGPGDQTLAVDIMAPDRSLKGKHDWTRVTVVLDVVGKATNVCFGFGLGGAGTAWADDLSLTSVSPAGTGPPVTSSK
jgi:hypothetical protein